MPEPEVLRDTMLRACVELELRHPQARSLMVTGPVGGEGTTTVALLLARLLAETNDVSVVLVDANLEIARGASQVGCSIRTRAPRLGT